MNLLQAFSRIRKCQIPRQPIDFPLLSDKERLPMTHPKSPTPEYSPYLAKRQLISQGLPASSSSATNPAHAYFGNTGDGQYTGEAPLTPAWGPEISSGVLAMDRLHHDLFSALDEVSCCKDQEFGARYADFVGKVERAFREEAQWMEDIDYSILAVHQEQHARVLSALHHVHSQVMDGDIGLGRRVVDELLPQWLVFHISTMDAVFAVAMQVVRNEQELALHSS